MYTNIDQKLVNSLHGLLNCEMGGLDCRVITTEYREHVSTVYKCNTYCNALVPVIYSVVSGQYSYTIHVFRVVIFPHVYTHIMTFYVPVIIAVY